MKQQGKASRRFLARFGIYQWPIEWRGSLTSRRLKALEERVDELAARLGEAERATKVSKRSGVAGDE